jgi:ABC-type polysaccharide/polyol phosphate export permease
MGSIAADARQGRGGSSGGCGSLWPILPRARWRRCIASRCFGWAWPLIRQLAQLAVLVVAFSHVLHLGEPHYAAFVFSGLIAWNWFSAGVVNGTSSLLDRRHLVLQPRLPLIALPLVAVVGR